ncbi:MAG: transglycosylase domain-containing protein [Christensenellales bacterium]|jgi:penicillin-binding protein 1A
MKFDFNPFRDKSGKGNKDESDFAGSDNGPKGRAPERIFVKRKAPSNFFISVIITTSKLLTVLVLTFGIAAGGLLLGIAKGYYDTTPELDTNRIDDQALTSFIYDMNGDLITAYRGSENRVWAGIDEIPEMLQDAFVALEDARFWTHNGIDIKRIFGAAVSNFTGGSIQGGSTITQQLIKLRVLSTEVSYKRKLQEAYLAIELEDEYEKEQILESYLNSIWLGGSNYGVKAAAMDYFGKELSQLTLKECAMLAGLTKNPSSYNPRRNYYQRDMPEITDERTERALYAMLENNYITHEEYETALDEPLNIVEESTVNQLYPMPYAVETVLEDVIDAFLSMRSMADNSANRSAIRREVQSNGYNIYTTIDPEVQLILENVVYNWDSYPALADSSNAVMRSVSANGVIIETEQPQAASVIYDYAAGELRAIVGSRQAPTQFLTLNRATKSTMPVGSSIKPLAVYGPALDLGYSPATVTENMEIPIEGWTTEKGYPSNASSRSANLLTLREGMVRSLNIASVHTLLDYVGLNTSKGYLTSLGVDPAHLNVDAFGLAMGSSGITPYEMAVGFGAIANSGLYQQPISFTRVTDSKGNVILDMKSQQESTKLQVFRPGTAYMLTDMLVNAVNSGTGTNARISGLTVGGKTGTNSDYVGAFFSGITPYYSCAVWVGHDNYKALASGSTGGKVAAPLFQAIMEQVHQEKELPDKAIIEGSPESMGLVRATTCSLSGLLATDACYMDPDHKPVTEWHHAENVPTESCVTHQMVELCAESGLLATPWCPHKVAGVKVVISPDMSIYKYGRDVLAPLWPNALYSTNSLAGDAIGLPDAAADQSDQSSALNPDSWASYLEGILGNQNQSQQGGFRQYQGIMPFSDPYCNMHNVYIVNPLPDDDSYNDGIYPDDGWYNDDDQNDDDDVFG